MEFYTYIRILLGAMIMVLVYMIGNRVVLFISIYRHNLEVFQTKEYIKNRLEEGGVINPVVLQKWRNKNLEDSSKNIENNENIT